MGKRRNKYQITLFGLDGEVLSSGTVILQKDFRGLQRQIQTNMRVGHCELIASDGEKFQVTSNNVISVKGKPFFKRIGNLLKRDQISK